MKMHIAQLILMLTMPIPGLWAKNVDCGIIEGKVTDSDTGEPIIYGPVSLLKDGLKVAVNQTDLDGNYKFNGIPEGIYSIELSYVGYQAIVTEEIPVNCENIKKLNIQLNAGVILGGVELITCCRKLIEQTPHEHGRIITAEDIRKLPLKTLERIAEETRGKSTIDNHAEVPSFIMDSGRGDSIMIPRKQSKRSKKKAKKKSGNQGIHE